MIRSSLTASIAAMALSSAAVFAKSNDQGGGKSAEALPPVVDPAAAPLPPITTEADVAAVATAETQPLLNNSLPTVPPKAERVKPVMTSVLGADIFAIPERKPRAGGKIGGQPLYDFDKLVNVGDSFGVMNKTAAQIASTVTGANERYKVQAKNPDGTGAFEEIKDANGNVIGHSKDIKRIPGKVFRAHDVDVSKYPAGTPDDQKAPTRVFLVEDHSADGLPIAK